MSVTEPLPDKMRYIAMGEYIEDRRAHLHLCLLPKVPCSLRKPLYRSNTMLSLKPLWYHP